MENCFLLIYNHFSLNPLHWLGFIIRIVTCGPNHAAEVEDGVVKEMSTPGLRWILKRWLTGKAEYAANNGCGYMETPWEQWAAKANRTVLVYSPTVELQDVPPTGYATRKLVQIALNIIRRKWLLIGHTWNGRDGVGRQLNFMVCSERLAKRLGIRRFWLVMPVDLEKVRELSFQYEFNTRKNVGVVNLPAHAYV